jgi:hypothetical protein
MSSKVTKDRQVTQSRDTVHAHSHKECKYHNDEEHNRGTAARYTVEQSMIHSVILIHSVTCVSRDFAGHSRAQQR